MELSMKTLWVSVGEISGDIHASYVVKTIYEHNPDIHIRGIGGSHLKNVGMECTFSIDSLSVMGVWDVIKKSFTIWKLLRAIKRDFIAAKPDALLVVDAPSFNFLLIKIAHSMGIPVYYYIIPKVWASRPHRVRFLARYCKALFCIFPFEIDWLKQHGIQGEYVGNPTLQYTLPIINNHHTKNLKHIIIMPGSRKTEVERLLPLFIQCLYKLKEYSPTIEFSCILAPSLSKEYVLSFIPNDLSIHIIPAEERFSAIAKAGLCIVASGTATLETALLGTPTIVTYKIGPLSAWLMKQFITIPFVSLPNIIMNKKILPELLQKDANLDTLFSTIIPLLEQSKQRQKMIAELHELYTLMYSDKKPDSIVAQRILQDLYKNSTTC